MLLGAGNTISNTVNAHQPQLDSLTNDLSAQLPGMWSRAQDTSQIQPGFGYANDVLSGKFLNANPYTQAMTQQAGNDAANHVNATFSQYGRTGSNNHATQLAKGVSQAENNVMFQNYQNERNNQNAAMSQLPALQAAQFSGYTPTLAAYQLAGQLPFYGTQALSGLGSLYGGYGTQTQSQSGGMLGDLLNAGAALGSAAIMHSDRRLKKNIRKVGEARDGLGIYEWVYKNDPSETVNKGVMADEVEKFRPWALVKNFRGEFAGVNYAVLGSMA